MQKFYVLHTISGTWRGCGEGRDEVEAKFEDADFGDLEEIDGVHSDTDYDSNGVCWCNYKVTGTIGLEVEAKSQKEAIDKAQSIIEHRNGISFGELKNVSGYEFESAYKYEHDLSEDEIGDR